MNWNKAKNIIVCFLLLLNFILVGMVYQENSRYVLSSDREQAIYQLLYQNRIGFYDKLMKEHRPKKQLNMQQYDYNMDELKEVFFKSTSVKRTDEFDKTILKSVPEGELLTLQSGYIHYENSMTADTIAPMESSKAQSLCEALLKKWGGEFKNFQLDGLRKTGEGYVLDYCQSYKGVLIYSNFFTFKVSNNGIQDVYGRYSQPVGYESNSREIYFSDEVLFTIIYELKNIYSNEQGLIINKMDLVYFQDETSTTGDIIMNATPYYRFYISGDTQPFLINAYTNTYISVVR